MSLVVKREGWVQGPGGDFTVLRMVSHKKRVTWAKITSVPMLRDWAIKVGFC